MSKKNNNILNDLSKMASSTVASMVNIKNDLSTYVHNQVKTSIKAMDFATRSEVATLKKTIEALQKEVAKLGGKTTPAKATTKPKAPAKTKTSKPAKANARKSAASKRK